MTDIEKQIQAKFETFCDETLEMDDRTKAYWEMVGLIEQIETPTGE